MSAAAARWTNLTGGGGAPKNLGGDDKGCSSIFVFV